MSATRTETSELVPRAIIIADIGVRPDGSGTVTSVEIDSSAHVAQAAREAAEAIFDVDLPTDSDYLRPRDIEGEGTSTHAVPDMSGFTGTEGSIWGKMTDKDGNPTHKKRVVFNRSSKYVQ